jgi:hypothetical protein
MGSESLEKAIARAGSPVDLLRHSAARPHTFPVAPEFTNWRSEQEAWRASCALLDQSHRHRRQQPPTRERTTPPTANQEGRSRPLPVPSAAGVERRSAPGTGKERPQGQQPGRYRHITGSASGSAWTKQRSSRSPRGS